MVYIWKTSLDQLVYTEKKSKKCAIKLALESLELIDKKQDMVTVEFIGTHQPDYHDETIVHMHKLNMALEGLIRDVGYNYWNELTAKQKNAIRRFYTKKDNDSVSPAQEWLVDFYNAAMASRGLPSKTKRVPYFRMSK